MIGGLDGRFSSVVIHLPVFEDIGIFQDCYLANNCPHTLEARPAIGFYGL
jgi:hypothetical protein